MENVAAMHTRKFLILLQVSILLYVAYILTYYFWSRNVDPDNSTIPYLTALGDLLGIMILGLTFEFLYLVGNTQLSVWTDRMQVNITIKYTFILDIQLWTVSISCLMLI